MHRALAIFAFSSAFLLSGLSEARLAGLYDRPDRAAAVDGIRVAQTVKYKKRKVHRPAWGSLENAQRKMKQGSKATGFQPKSQPVVHRDPVLSKKAKFVSVAPKPKSDVGSFSQANPANAAKKDRGWWPLIVKLKWVLLGAFGIGAVGLLVLRFRPS